MTQNILIKNHLKTESLPLKDWSYHYFSSIKEMGAEWDEISTQYDVPLSKKYLETVEDNPSVDMEFGYLLFYKEGKPMGKAILQIQLFNAEKSIRDTEENKKYPCFFTVVGNHLKKMVSKHVVFKTIVIGNLMLTGDYGYRFNESIDNKDQEELIRAAVLDVKTKLKQTGQLKAPVILLKEFYEEKTTLENQEFAKFQIQPNMILNMRPNWETMEDYLGEMSSKYRTRAKRAFKMSDGLTLRELNPEEIEAEMPTIFELYKMIAKSAGFNVMVMNPAYLLGLKRNFPSDFRLMGYYNEDEQLVGFFTTLHNKGLIDAHYLGFNPALNRSHQIYQNILYEIVRIGIEEKAEKINFGRTAVEIKSTVGAEMVPMYCYMKHQSIPNNVARLIIDYLSPKEETFVPRRPFK